MTHFLTLALIGTVLLLVQSLAALPWLYALDQAAVRKLARDPVTLLSVLGFVVVGGAALGGIMVYWGDAGQLVFQGRIYASVLHLQLAVDFFVLALGLMLAVWPRGGTVAMAAFREGYRQPMFWLLVGFTVVALGASMVIPYFTFGDDFKMMKQLSFDMIMLATALFCVLAASMSISEEIEGRTAVTLMSKPVTRRQFLLGKYVGILLAGWAMISVIGWVQNWALYVKPYFDRLEDAVDPLVNQAQAVVTPPIQAALGFAPEMTHFGLGVGAWTGEIAANLLGLFLGYGQVMVLLAIATSLATRVPMVVNLVLCLLFFFLGHLAPVLVQVSQQLSQKADALALVSFLAQLLDKVLPSLDFFNTSQVFIRETQLDLGPFAWYVGSVLLYALAYTGMALLAGLILFEDRDLA